MVYVIELNGIHYEVVVERGKAEIVTKQEAPVPIPVPVAQTTQPVAASPVTPVATPTGNVLKSPMPGMIVNILVKPGDAVKAGDTLIVLEAMKMENEIASPNDGTIQAIHTTKGAQVNTDDLLILFA